MIRNIQASPLSSLLAATNPQQTSALGSGSGSTQSRFDLTLLQVTKQAIDSTAADPAATTVPNNVSKALESVLQALAQAPGQSLAQYGKNASATSVQHALVDQAAAAGNLTVSEHKQLDDLVGMAVNRIQSNAQSGITQAGQTAMNGTNRVTPVLNSGPQGGTTESQSSTLDSVSNIHPSKHAAQQDTFDVSQQLPQLAAVVSAPIVVSTRGQAGTDALSQPSSPVTGSAALNGASAGSSTRNATSSVSTAQAQKPANANQPVTELTMQSDSQASGGFSQGIPVMALNADSQLQAPLSASQIKPENQNNTQSNQTKSNVVLGSNHVAVEHGETFAQSQQRGVTGSVQGMQQSSTPPVPIQTTVTPPILPSDMPVVEVLGSNETLPTIVPGSEIQLNDLVSSPSSQQQPSSVVNGPALPTPQVQLPTGGLMPVIPGSVVTVTQQATLTQPGSVLQGQNPFAVQLVAESVPSQNGVSGGPNGVPEQNSEPVPQGTSSDNAQSSSSLTPLQRFLNNNATQNGTAVNTGNVQAPVSLTRDSLQDLAQSVTKQYGLRQNVFQQALSAIEDASQGQNQIRIQLKPEALGTLDVSLSVEGGKLTARLIAGNSEVRDVLASNLAQFKQALESQGLQVSQLSVAVRADSGSQGQAQQQWQQNQALLRQVKTNENPQATNPWASVPASAFSQQDHSTFSALA